MSRRALALRKSNCATAWWNSRACSSGRGRGCTGEFPPRLKKKLPLCSTYAKKKGKKGEKGEPAANQTANQNPLPRRYFTQRHQSKIDPRGDDFAIFYREPRGVSDAVARGHHLRMRLRRQNRDLATPGGEKPPTHATINLRRRWDFRSLSKNTPLLNK
jgi:hypothetical protein